MLQTRICFVFTVVFLLTHGAPASAFTYFFGFPGSSARWADGYGLEGGIDVAVEAGFESSVGATNDAEKLLVRQAVVNAFSAWENPALQFNIAFDQSVTVDPNTGAEIDLMALPASNAVWPAGLIFGLAQFDFPYRVRTLTNGQAVNGYTIERGDIYLHIEAIAYVSSLLPDDTARLAALTRLMMHEVGHIIGLAHTNYTVNYDTDTDPNNPMILDPADPHSNLMLTRVAPTDAIMNPRPCGLEFVNCPPTFYTGLTNDDIGGRDALYPVVPEPGTGTMFLAVAGGFALLRRSVRAG